MEAKVRLSLYMYRFVHFWNPKICKQWVWAYTFKVLGILACGRVFNLLSIFFFSLFFRPYSFRFPTLIGQIQDPSTRMCHVQMATKQFRHYCLPLGSTVITCFRNLITSASSLAIKSPNKTYIPSVEYK